MLLSNEQALGAHVSRISLVSGKLTRLSLNIS